MNEISREARRHARRTYKRVKSVAERLTSEYGMTEQEAIASFYHSRLYQLLADEKTKVWWLSTPVLLELYQTETETGELDGAPYLDGLAG
ncbi:MAG: hypothetical protein LBS67_01865 [Clostridiales Family XIII bacterium]|jgi:hypothetical protein|nr:hypothetical protein [Clostridiales Family XIII bacterium]